MNKQLTPYIWNTLHTGNIPANARIVIHFDNNTILAVKKSPRGKFNIPGGHINVKDIQQVNDNPIVNCVLRETREELNVNFKPGDIHKIMCVDYTTVYRVNAILIRNTKNEIVFRTSIENTTNTSIENTTNTNIENTSENTTHVIKKHNPSKEILLAEIISFNNGKYTVNGKIQYPNHELTRMYPLQLKTDSGSLLEPLSVECNASKFFQENQQHCFLDDFSMTFEAIERSIDSFNKYVNLD